MSDVHSAQSVGTARPAGHAAGPSTQRTGWTGWLTFAAVTMIVVGAFQVIEGLVAVFQDGYYLVPATRLVVHVDYTAWGWVHFGIGAAIVIAGLGLFTGHLWARILAIALAAASAIINLAFLAAFPLWAFIIIGFDAMVIYAVAVHGPEMSS